MNKRSFGTEKKTRLNFCLQIQENSSSSLICKMEPVLVSLQNYLSGILNSCLSKVETQ